MKFKNGWIRNDHRMHAGRSLSPISLQSDFHLQPPLPGVIAPKGPDMKAQGIALTITHIFTK
jgi:hypothetical protein